MTSIGFCLYMKGIINGMCTMCWDRCYISKIGEYCLCLRRFANINAGDTYNMRQRPHAMLLFKVNINQ